MTRPPSPPTPLSAAAAAVAEATATATSAYDDDVTQILTRRQPLRSARVRGAALAALFGDGGALGGPAAAATAAARPAGAMMAAVGDGFGVGDTLGAPRAARVGGGASTRDGGGGRYSSGVRRRGGAGGAHKEDEWDVEMSFARLPKRVVALAQGGRRQVLGGAGAGGGDALGDDADGASMVAVAGSTDTAGGGVTGGRERHRDSPRPPPRRRVGGGGVMESGDEVDDLCSTMSMSPTAGSGEGGGHAPAGHPASAAAARRIRSIEASLDVSEPSFARMPLPGEGGASVEDPTDRGRTNVDGWRLVHEEETADGDDQDADGGGDSDGDDGALSSSSEGAPPPVVGSLPWRLGRFCIVVRELDSETGQERACHLLAALASRRKDLLPAIGAAGGVEAVLEALRDYMTVAAVVQRALGALKALTAADELREAVVSLYGAEAVISAMAAHARSTRIQDRGATVLANAAFGSEMRKRRIGRSGGLDAILAAMRAHARDEETAARCCLAVRNLTFRSQVNQYLGGRAGGVSTILDAMRRFPANAQLQYQAVVALSNLSADDKANRAAIVGVGGGRDSLTGGHLEGGAASPSDGLRLVLGALRRDAGNGSLAEHAVALLFHVVTQAPVVQVRVGELGGVAVVAATMRRHLHREALLAKGCALLRSLCFSPANRPRLRDCGGLRCVLAVISVYGGSPRAVEPAISALGNAVYGEPTNRELIGSLGGIPPLLNALRECGGSAVIQTHGCRALRNLADGCPSNVRRMVAGTKAAASTPPTAIVGGTGGDGGVGRGAAGLSVHVSPSFVAVPRPSRPARTSMSATGRAGVAPAAPTTILTAVNVAVAALSTYPSVAAVQQQAVALLANLAADAECVGQMAAVGAGDWVENALATLPQPRFPALHQQGDHVLSVLAGAAAPAAAASADVAASAATGAVGDAAPAPPAPRTRVQRENSGGSRVGLKRPSRHRYGPGGRERGSTAVSPTSLCVPVPVRRRGGGDRGSVGDRRGGDGGDDRGGGGDRRDAAAQLMPSTSAASTATSGGGGSAKGGGAGPPHRSLRLHLAALLGRGRGGGAGRRRHANGGGGGGGEGAIAVAVAPLNAAAVPPPKGDADGATETVLFPGQGPARGIRPRRRVHMAAAL